MSRRQAGKVGEEYAPSPPPPVPRFSQNGPELSSPSDQEEPHHAVVGDMQKNTENKMTVPSSNVATQEQLSNSAKGNSARTSWIKRHKNKELNGGDETLSNSAKENPARSSWMKGKLRSSSDNKGELSDNYTQGHVARKSWIMGNNKKEMIADKHASVPIQLQIASVREHDHHHNRGVVVLQPQERALEEGNVLKPDDMLPTATPVLVPEATVGTGGSSSQEGRDSIAIAVEAKWWDAWKNKRLRIGILVAILVIIGGTVGGVVYVVTSSSSNSDSSSSFVDPTNTTTSTAPTTLVPTSPKVPTVAPSMGPTSAPTTLVLQQLGQTLVNEAEDDPAGSMGPRGELYFGWAVVLSQDGTRLVVGAPYHQRVYIYDLNHENRWVQTAIIQEESGLVDHVSLSGDGTVLALGVPRNSEIHDNGGKVQVYFAVNATSWQPMGDAIYGQGPGDRIGGFIDDDQYPDFADIDYYDDDYTQLSIDSYDSSSMALSENGQVLAVGSSRGNYVLVFFFDTATLQWSKLGTTDFVGENEGDQFGTTVDLSADGHRMVVGAPDNIGRADPTWDIYVGHVRVFQYQADDDLWIKLGQDIDGDRLAGDESYGQEGEKAGSVVSISADGTTIAVGANFQAASEDIYSLGDRDGHVIVYRYAESRDEWVQVGNTVNIFQFGLVIRDDLDKQDKILAGLDSDKYPVVSRLSRDGNRLAISAMAASLGDEVTGRGVVRLYSLIGETWKLIGTPIEGVSEFDHSGRSISLSYDGTRLAVGAPEHNANGLDDGQVRVFSLEGVTAAPEVPTSSPTTVAPSPTPGPPVPITILFDLTDDPAHLAWSLECNGAVVTNKTQGRYNSSEFVEANVTETFLVPDGSICKMWVSSDFNFDTFKVFYGNAVSDMDLVLADSALVDFDFQPTVSFYVSPTTTSLSVTTQLDAFPYEISMTLRCDGFAFVDIPLGGLLSEGLFAFVNLTLTGIQEGVVCEYVIEDVFGDGICCAHGIGYYRINYGGPSGNLLAAGGRFADKEVVTFVVSPKEDPITTAPTESPSFAPTATAAQTDDFAFVTVVIQLSNQPQEVSWALQCNNRTLTNVLFGTYTTEDAGTLVVEPFSVGPGSLCRFVVTTIWGFGLGFNSYYELYFGQNVTDDTNLIASGSEFGFLEVVTFEASPPS